MNVQESLYSHSLLCVLNKITRLSGSPQAHEDNICMKLWPGKTIFFKKHAKKIYMTVNETLTLIRVSFIGTFVRRNATVFFFDNVGIKKKKSADLVISFIPEIICRSA